MCLGDGIRNFFTGGILKCVLGSSDNTRRFTLSFPFSISVKMLKISRLVRGLSQLSSFFSPISFCHWNGRASAVCDTLVVSTLASTLVSNTQLNNIFHSIDIILLIIDLSNHRLWCLVFDTPKIITSMWWAGQMRLFADSVFPSRRYLLCLFPHDSQFCWPDAGWVVNLVGVGGGIRHMVPTQVVPFFYKGQVKQQQPDSYCITICVMLWLS